MPDLDTIRVFSSREVRDEVAAELEDVGEDYEQWLPIDLTVITRVMYEEAKLRNRKI